MLHGIFLSVAHLRKAYLELIPKEDWVHYAQVARGAHTYGWRTSNQAEIGMACAKKMRLLFD
jgi:hypothetical protein